MIKGVNTDDRIGNKVTLRHLEIRILLTSGQVYTIPYRVFVLHDLRAAEQLPPLDSQIFQTSATVLDTINSPTLPQTRQRFRLIYDHAAVLAGLSVTPAATTQPAQTQFLRLFKSLNVNVHYGLGNTGTSLDITDHAFYLCWVIHDHLNVSIAYQVVLTFTDS
jgi:hypothetical protein